MKFISRLVIIIPTFVLIFALYGFLNRKSIQDQSSIPLELNAGTVTPIPEPTIQFTIPDILIASESGKLDLTGPIACFHKLPDGTEDQAFFQDGQVAVDFYSEERLSHVRLVDDCLYKWEEDEKEGSKMCGIGQYMDYYNQFSQTGMLGNIAEEIPATFGIQAETLNAIFSSCLKEPIKGDPFVIPKSVSFVEGADTNTTAMPSGDFLQMLQGFGL
ncbi:hypothetical protein KC726_05320 [Candidatus Woesebacteria bacterium]|nr:hypothetical protein [Candidatus Woesebacteria bacterium]